MDGIFTYLSESPMRFRCPTCSCVFELDALPPEGLARCPSCMSTIKVGRGPSAAGAAARAKTTRNLPADPDFRSIPSVRFPPTTAPAYLSEPPPPPPPRYDALQQYGVDAQGKQRSRRSSGGNPAVKVIAWVVGGFAALFLGLIALGGFGYYAMTQTNWLNAEMTLAGYKTSAPGRLVAVQSGTRGQSEVGVLNRRTGSQFQMIFVPDAGRGGQVTAEVFMLGLALKATVTERHNVTRAGLAGVHFKTAHMQGASDMEGEVFSVSGGVLLVVYQSAHDLEGQRGKIAKFSVDKEREADRVDEFFASLQPQ